MILRAFCETSNVLQIFYFINMIVKILCYVVPAILILMLTIDIFKNVMSGEDNVIKNNMKMIVKRTIFAVAIFFVPMIVNISFGLLGNMNVSAAKCYNNANLSTIQSLKEKEAKEYEEYLAKKKAETKKKIEQERQEEQDMIRENAANASGSNPKELKGTKYKTSYNSIRILKTFSPNNCKKIASIKGTGNITIAQSLAYTGKYYVIGMISRGNNAKLFVYNKNGKLVNTHSASSLGHSNGMTYGKDGKIYVVNPSYTNKLYCVPASNIANKGTVKKNCVTLRHSPSGLAYDSHSDKYYLIGGTNLRVYSSDWKYIHTVKAKRRYINQDIGAYGGRILEVISGSSNYVDMYNYYNKKYLGSFKLKNLGAEFESVAADSDGRLIFLFHNSGSSEGLWITKDPVFS